MELIRKQIDNVVWNNVCLDLTRLMCLQYRIEKLAFNGAWHF